MTTSIPAFDETIEKTNIWLDELQRIMGWERRDRAYMALRAVLHALRDRLPPNEAVQLAAQLPMLVRGFFYEGWRPADKPLEYRDKAHFLAQIAREAPWLKDQEAERAVTAVLEVLGSHVPGGETEQVRHLLPRALRELWARPAL